MSIFLAVAAILLGIAGLLGSVVPVLPGPPLSWIGLLLISFTKYADFSIWFLAIWLVVVVAVTLADNFLPLWMTRKYGGSRPATIGTFAGMVAGIFFAPWGMIVGPFIGAFVGELVGNRSEGHVALRVATGAFAAFICGVGLKLIASGMMLFYMIREIIV